MDGFLHLHRHVMSVDEEKEIFVILAFLVLQHDKQKHGKYQVETRHFDPFHPGTEQACYHVFACTTVPK